MIESTKAAVGFMQDEIIVDVGCDASTAYLVRRATGGGIAAACDPAADWGSDFCAMLLAMAAHDLRQPLQIILATHDALDLRMRGTPEGRYIERIARAASQISSKLELLLEALRLRQTIGNTELEPVWLDAALGELVGELADRARRKGIELRVAGARARIWSQPALLSGMLSNLICNAIECTPHGGRVFVGCRRRGGLVRIEVRDNGPGIPNQQREDVFRAFQRGATTRSGGLGLGLFIVKRAADFLGHGLELRSACGRGSCFAVIAEAHDPSRKPSFGSEQEGA